MESIYNVAGALLTTYIDELSAPADENRLTTYELISLERERQLTPRLSISREQLAKESARRIPAGRL